MKTMNVRKATFFASLSLLLVLGACKKKGCTDSKATNYSEEAKKDDGSCIYDTINPVIIDSSKRVVLSLDVESLGLYPLHLIENIESGSEDVANAQELLGSTGALVVASKGGFIYVNDYSGETFKKLQNKDGVLTEVGSVPNLGVNGNPLHTFLDDNRILLTSKQFWPTDPTYSYQVINTTTMTEESSGDFTLPIQGDHPDYSYMYATNYLTFEGNLYIPFVEADGADGAIYDSAGVAIYNASTLAYVDRIYTTNTAALCNGFSPSYAVADNGDLYMASSNTGLYANNESVPSGIVRIKSGQTDFDDSYFFDITAATGHHSLGMLYLGGSKAIVQVFNADLLASSDYYVQYYVVDLAAETASLLDIPTSKGGYYGSRRSMTLLGNGNAAIITNNAGGSSIYIYDAMSNSVSQGATYAGADAIVGIRAY